jgi:hypothetical protein
VASQSTHSKNSDVIHIIGYLQTPNWDGSWGPIDSCILILGLPDHVIMTSFEGVDLGGSVCDLKHVSIFSGAQCQADRLDRFCHRQFPPPRVYYRHLISVHYVNADQSTYYPAGFKMLYSFHNASSVPQQLSDGSWNCSVRHWTDFRHHLPCDLEPQCRGGEDEAECPYTTQRCGQGRIDLQVSR